MGWPQKDRPFLEEAVGGGWQFEGKREGVSGDGARKVGGAFSPVSC